MLAQLKHQFDVVSPESRLEAYDLLVLPDVVPVDDALAARLRDYVAAGGAVLATGVSGLSADGTRVTFDPLGVAAHGLSPFTATYFRADPAFAEGIPDTDHVVYDRGVRVTPTGARRPSRRSSSRTSSGRGTTSTPTPRRRPTRRPPTPPPC